MYTFRDRTGLSQRVIYGQDAATTGLHLRGMLYVLDPTILRAIINYHPSRVLRYNHSPKISNQSSPSSIGAPVLCVC